MTLLHGERRPAWATLTFALASGLALAGCGINRVVPSGDMSADGRDIHPIAISESNYSTDIFPVGGGLDRRTALQIHDFAQRYRQVGQGPVTVLVPHGGPAAAQTAAAASIVRADLENELRHPVALVPYPVTDPSLAAPMRLTFLGIKAKVANKCGEWPADIASASSLRGWQNEPYWNFGCSNQSMLAAQVADPRDLAGPQGDQPTDTGFRTRAVTAVRAGKDPSTSWKISNTSIGTVGQ